MKITGTHWYTVFWMDWDVNFLPQPKQTYYDILLGDDSFSSFLKKTVKGQFKFILGCNNTGKAYDMYPKSIDI